MVIFFEWHQTAMDQRRGLPMTGEETGLEALASPLVGYLGKVQERAASLDFCPWCTSKGSTYALRSYRVNLQESITLCTNPQCLFPLVSRSLEDVLADLVPVEPTVANKRTNSLALEKGELIKPKRLRSREFDNLGPQSITDAHISQAECGAMNIVSNGEPAATKTDGEMENGHNGLSRAAETTAWKLIQDEEDVPVKKPENAAGTEGLVSPTASADHLHSSSEEPSSIADGEEPMCFPHHGALGTPDAADDFKMVKCSPEMLSSLDPSQSGFTNGNIAEINNPAVRERKPTTAYDNTLKDVSDITTESKELVSVVSPLFWRNDVNLCWLDALLVVFVNCKSLKACRPEEDPQRSSVWRLMREYESTCAAVQVHQQIGKDGNVIVPNHVLQTANADLKSLRMSIFKQLQQQLKCKLGQRESPVFAMPLLLKSDSWAEPLFQSTFHWEFQCSECKTFTKERLMKTLPSFTNIVPDWRPLHATHFAPCNVCCKKNQRRTMMLERVPPVFALHFVEGLPDNDVRIYTFDFEGKRYSVSTVIQYNQHLKHFVTWICKSDGSWLEFDDLKHPHCKTHRKFPVPAQEMHIVFWEVEESKEPRACSPTSTFPVSSPTKPVMNDTLSDEALVADDTDIVCALSGDNSSIMDTTVTTAVDTSIGSTTLLDAFEGLSQNDIITLTLVELKAGSELQPLDDNEPTQDFGVPSSKEIPHPVPDSSSVISGNEMSHGDDVERPITTGECVKPDESKGLRRSKRNVKAKPASEKQKGEKAAPRKAAPKVSKCETSEPSEAIDSNPVAAAVQDKTPARIAHQTSPASSTDTSPRSTSKSEGQSARWSFLLSQHPVARVQRSVVKPAPTSVTQIRPTPPSHSTPNPVRRQTNPAPLLPKPQLKMEENEGLPLKAAERYGGFNSKISIAPSPPLAPAFLNGKSNLTSENMKSLTNARQMPGHSPLAPGMKSPPEITSKKHGSRTSKIPAGLSSTEALRYKLMKKLNAKKKKLAKLNDLLGPQGGASSLNLVTSSTYDGSNCDQFLTDLLSPATTASNLSPDSSGFLEMLSNRQDGVDHFDSGVVAVGETPQTNSVIGTHNTENYFDDFLSQAVAQQPSEMETEALSALDLFF